MALEQFDRNAKLTIAELGDPFGLAIEFAQDRGLRFSFDVTKTNDLQPNTATITIYNLAEDTRSDLTRKVRRLAAKTYSLVDGAVPGNVEQTAFALGAAYVKLSAGYGRAPSQVMEGTSTSITSSRSGSDWRTILTFGDGELQARAALANQSFAPGTPFAVVIQYLIDTLGVDNNPAELALALAGKPAVTTGFPKGVLVTGPARKKLEQLLGLLEIRASIQDGRFQILTETGTTLDAPIPLSLSNGLLDKPRPLEDNAFEVRTLLLPELSPGRPVALVSADVSGAFRVEQVTHRGDTHGGDWFSVAELREPFAVEF